jgi:hypothetical protein
MTNNTVEFVILTCLMTATNFSKLVVIHISPHITCFVAELYHLSDLSVNQ